MSTFGDENIFFSFWDENWICGEWMFNSECFEYEQNLKELYGVKCDLGVL